MTSRSRAPRPSGTRTRVTLRTVLGTGITLPRHFAMMVNGASSMALASAQIVKAKRIGERVRLAHAKIPDALGIRDYLYGAVRSGRSTEQHRQGARPAHRSLRPGHRLGGVDAETRNALQPLLDG